MTKDETKFPYDWGMSDYRRFKIDDWFIRCIEDLPKFPDTAHALYAVYWYKDFLLWFKKWFTQFMIVDTKQS